MPWYTDPANLARLIAYLASEDPSLTAADVADIRAMEAK